MEIKIYPDPCLRIQTKPVERFDREIGDILRSMTDMMYIYRGIGLAATQVGLGLSILVIDIGEELMSFINPVILDVSNDREKMEEGCLSLPGIMVNVSRPRKVTVRAQDKAGSFFMKQLDGLSARAVQHEMDHLNGRLIIDYLDPVRRFLTTRKLKSSKNRQIKKTCEVICNVRRKNKRDTETSA
ncbi:MAG: peptide deformylase [Candidatus Omnitrophota bacterium]